MSECECRYGGEGEGEEDGGVEMMHCCCLGVEMVERGFVVAGDVIVFSRCERKSRSWKGNWRSSKSV